MIIMMIFNMSTSYFHKNSVHYLNCEHVGILWLFVTIALNFFILCEKF
jgi:hypothetical protein